MIEPVVSYAVIIDPRVQPSLMAALVEIGGPDVAWAPDDAALLWVPDHRIALHVAMAVDGRLKADQLVRVPIEHREIAKAVMDDAYPDFPYRWLYRVIVAFESKEEIEQFDRRYERYIREHLSSPVTSGLLVQLCS